MRDRLGRFIKGHKPTNGFKENCIPWNKNLKGWTKIYKNAGFQKGHLCYSNNIKKGIRFSPLTEFQKGHKRGMIGKHHSEKTKQKIGGKNHPNWKGGIGRLYDKIKQSEEYKTWRRDVFIRDHFTCQKCRHRFINIIAHHIKSFAEYKKLWFKVSNGQTLCRSCHIKIHKSIRK